MERRKNQPTTNTTPAVMNPVIALPPGWNHRVSSVTRAAKTSEPHFARVTKRPKVDFCSSIAWEPSGQRSRCAVL